jgi:hypothetical protein
MLQGRSGDFLDRYRKLEERVRRLETRKQPKVDGGTETIYWDFHDHAWSMPLFDTSFSSTEPSYFYGWNIEDEYIDDSETGVGLAGLAKTGDIVQGFGALQYNPPVFSNSDPDRFVPGEWSDTANAIIPSPWWSDRPIEVRKWYLRSTGVDALWSPYSVSNYWATGNNTPTTMPNEFKPWPAGTHIKVGVNFQNSYTGIQNSGWVGEYFVGTGGFTSLNMAGDSGGQISFPYRDLITPTPPDLSIWPDSGYVPPTGYSELYEGRSGPGYGIWVDLESITYLAYRDRPGGTEVTIPWET